jgi:hypothetical protein
MLLLLLALQLPDNSAQPALLQQPLLLLLNLPPSPLLLSSLLLPQSLMLPVLLLPSRVLRSLSVLQLLLAVLSLLLARLPAVALQPAG